MRLPILYTMSWPERVHCSEQTWPRLDFVKMGDLTFRWVNLGQQGAVAGVFRWVDWGRAGSGSAFQKAGRVGAVAAHQAHAAVQLPGGGCFVRHSHALVDPV